MKNQLSPRPHGPKQPGMCDVVWLTEAEQEDLRRDLAESASYVRVYFRALYAGKLDDLERADQRLEN